MPDPGGTMDPSAGGHGPAGGLAPPPDESRPGPAGDPEAPYARLAVVCLISHALEDRWLLVRPPRDDEVWSPAGGRLEAGESLEDAVHREMEEELGLAVEVAGPCYAYLTVHKGERMLGVTMACRVTEPEVALRLDPDEAVDHRWVTREEWLELVATGLTPWGRDDLIKATTLARTLLALRETLP